MSSEIAIKVENLSKCYQIYDRPRDRLLQMLARGRRQYFREFWALNDVSFEIAKGETVGIIGRNGSGKSTLLQLICGTLNPTSGSIRTHGRIAALLELGSGFNPDFTGRENVYLNAAVLGLSKEEVDARFDVIAAFADIGEFIEQPVKAYSSGMMVRLAFAVIAHVDADILVVDEALAVGDAFFTQKCMRHLRKFQKNGGTLLFVSHDTGAVTNLCSSAVLLSRGKIDAIGSPKEISEYYLSTLYKSRQEVSGTSIERQKQDSIKANRREEYRDMRESLINSSTLRNDIEIFQFNPENSAFGTGEATIQAVRLLDSDGKHLSWIVGGEDVILEIECLANKDIFQPIIGFDLKDRLGQIIFCDNTYLAFQDNPVFIASGRGAVARFEFRLPILPTGNYTVSAAIANGTQDDHIQLHWLHDAIAFKVHASSTVFGLIGLPLRKIHLESK
jgi:lipopolysaccharide transport system ATP-binding protein